MNKDDFFSAAVRMTKCVKVNGIDVDIRELTARDRQQMRTATQEGKTPDEVSALIVRLGCAMFDDGDLDRLRDLPGGVLETLTDSILELSGLTGASRKAAKKNS